MGRDKRNERRKEQFTRWLKSERDLPAWKALSYPARDAYFHLRVRCFAETKNARNNNGEVYRSLRDLAEDLGGSAKTAGAALADLQAKGWIVCTNAWERGTDGSGKAATFRLTMMAMDKRAPTKEPELWQPGHDYPVTVYRSYLPKPRASRKTNLKKQNPPPQSGTPPCPIGAQLRAVKS